ncbi:heavy metal-associated isoprenylated plant protein 47-like [Lotus japonicus]|uniref:heavy metal-associated isoprenylated plant protein 47-like n=1 Tax=Lotus japonicus TaxID=34305 RepID=UPI002585C9BA|nr:heavy metal-associated isoprenylated plant protein 47-like [Lotus japonicus]
MKIIVVEVHMKDDKCRSKAMKIAAAFQGVQSVSLEGEGRDQVVVTGDRIDSVCLTSKLRKKFSYATLLSVGDAKDSNNEGGDVEGTEEKVTTSTENFYVPYSYANYPHPSYHVVYDPYPSSCSIM